MYGAILSKPSGDSVASNKKSGFEDAKSVSAPLAPGLYLVATPIGNLRDITLRALDVLNEADLIACEDTRVTGRLLSHFGINTAKTPYHDFSDDTARQRLLDMLGKGQSIALVSDAGSPLIADPGYKLVRDAAEAGHPVIPVPGPSAMIAGVSASGLPTDRILFAGFPPSKKQARQRFLQTLAAVPATLVLYESPRRIEETVSDMAAVFSPDRQASISREITKLHEEHRRGTLSELQRSLPDMTKKGELVLIIGPPQESETTASPEDIDAMLLAALETGNVKQAAASVAATTGVSKRDLYARAVSLKNTLRDTGADEH